AEGGQHADERLAVDRHEVVRAGGADLDVTGDDQLVELFDVFEFGQRRRAGEAALHDLVHEHAGDAPGGIPRVVVVAVIDVEDIEQLGQLAGGGGDHRCALCVVERLVYRLVR